MQSQVMPSREKLVELQRKAVELLRRWKEMVISPILPTPTYPLPSQVFFSGLGWDSLLLMEEILHHLGYINKPCK